MTDQQTATFLGTLPSELDDDSSGMRMHPAFEQLAGSTYAVRAAFLGSRVSAEVAAELFASLRLTDQDGAEWTMGPTSGKWYRRVGGSPGWQHGPLPFGRQPHPQLDLPSWAADGIYGQLAEAQQAHRDSADSAQTTGVDVLSAGGFNPFQSTSVPAVRVETGPQRPTAPAAGAADWLLDEWEAFEQDRERLRQLRYTAGTQVPEDLPDDLNPNRQLTDAAAGSGAPAARQGHDTPAEGPAARFDPEEFFRAPE